MTAPVLVLALDGATFDVIRPMASAGRLPHLSRWMVEGASTGLESTVPPVTFPAWSSFATGLEPGEHGIFDFTQKLEGAYRLRFVNASDRSGESLFLRSSRAGKRVLVLGLPATFPPEPVNGLLVSGFDAPVSAGTDDRSASDPALYREIAARVGPWMRPELDEQARGNDFHERAAATLLARIERKRDFALEALRTMARADGAPDLCCIVFSESDTVGHHYWRDHDPASPRHDPAASAQRRSAVEDVYEALDRACGELHAAYSRLHQREPLAIVLSDHGMGGAARHVIHLNRYLVESGFLARKRVGALDRVARAARDGALRLLPPRVAQTIFRHTRRAAASLESVARFGGFDWARTSAFSEEANTQPGVWINAAGREQQGSVAREDYERLRAEVIEALLSWKLPDASPVIASALPREEIYSGPYVCRAPDIVLELGREQDYGLSLVPTPWHDPSVPSLRCLEDHELAGGRGRGMNGTHRSTGIWIAAGAPDPLRGVSQPRLSQVAPALLGVLGLHPTRGGVEASGTRRYSEDEETLVAARLRALGYLE